MSELLGCMGNNPSHSTLTEKIYILFSDYSTTVVYRTKNFNRHSTPPRKKIVSS